MGAYIITVISKNRPTLGKSPPPFLKVVVKGAFLSKVCPPVYASVYAVALRQETQKQQQEEGQASDGRHRMLLLQEHEALQNHCMCT